MTTAENTKSQPRPSAPGPVTDTTEGICSISIQMYPSRRCANLSPASPQSLLAKQHNLVPVAVGTADTQQNTMPLDGAEKELLTERVHNTGAQTPSSLAAQIERELQHKNST